jgi:hypothetical protein
MIFSIYWFFNKRFIKFFAIYFNEVFIFFYVLIAIKKLLFLWYLYVLTVRFSVFFIIIVLIYSIIFLVSLIWCTSKTTFDTLNILIVIKYGPLIIFSIRLLLLWWFAESRAHIFVWFRIIKLSSLFSIFYNFFASSSKNLFLWLKVLLVNYWLIFAIDEKMSRQRNVVLLKNLIDFSSIPEKFLAFKVVNLDRFS